MSDLFQRLKGDFRDEEYRHVYTNSFVDSKVATQIKVLREQRGWTQAQLADETGMCQARVSVLEDVNYSSWTLSILRRFARAFDLYVDVEFKPFGTLRVQLDEMDREHLQRAAFDEDPVFNSRNEAASELSEAVSQKIAGSDHQQSKPPLQLVPIDIEKGRAITKALCEPQSERSNLVSWPTDDQGRQGYAAIGGNAR